MKRKTLKPISFRICILICSLVLVINAKAQTTNFTGDWKVNLEKSDFGTLPKSFAAAEFKIIQNQSSINIDRIIVFRDSSTKSEEILNFDGSITISDFKIKKKEASIKWSTQGKSLIETAIQKFINKDGKNDQYHSVETFSLSEDKKTLFYIRQVTGNDMNFTVKAEYDKIE